MMDNWDGIHKIKIKVKMFGTFRDFFPEGELEFEWENFEYQHFRNFHKRLEKEFLDRIHKKRIEIPDQFAIDLFRDSVLADAHGVLRETEEWWKEDRMTLKNQTFLNSHTLELALLPPVCGG